LNYGAQRFAAHQQNESNVEAQAEGHKKDTLGPNGANQRVWPYPGASKTLGRPFTSLSGRRRVPKIVNANRVPLLRLKKPQSPFVSRIIRDTIDTRERRITLANQLDEQLPMAMDEDEWDKILFDQFGLEDDLSWSHELRLAIEKNGTLQTAATQKRIDLAARVHSIVQQEKALANEEALRIRDEKHKRRKTNRLARRGQAMPVAEHDMTLDSTESASQEVDPHDKDSEKKNPGETVAGKIIPDSIVRDKERFQTKEEIAGIRAANAMTRTEDEIASIKAARARRKEAAAKEKAGKVKRRAESIQYWQEKLGKHSNDTANAPDWLIPPDLPTRKNPYTFVLERSSSGASEEPLLRRKPQESDSLSGHPSESSAHKEQAKIQ